LYLLAGESIEGKDALKKDYVQQILGKVANTKLKSLLSEVLRLNPEKD